MKFHTLRVCSFALLIMTLSSPAGAGMRIEFRGNEQMRTGRLRRILPELSRDRKGFDMRRWTNAARASLLSLYRERGFFDAEVSVTREEPRPGDTVAVFSVREGNGYRFDTVELIPEQGAQIPVITFPSLQSRVSERFRRDRILSDRSVILQSLRNKGYLHAEVRDSLGFIPGDSANVKLFFIVQPRRAVVLDSLVIENRRSGDGTRPGLTDPGLIRSLLPYDNGDTVTGTDNRRVVDKLRNTRVFSSISLDDSVVPGRTDSVSTLYLDLVEEIPGQFAASIFYETEEGPGVEVYVSHTNAGGKFRRLFLETTFALRKQQIGAGYSNPLLFGRDLRFDNELDVAWYQLGRIRDVMESRPLGGDFEAFAISRLSHTFNERFSLQTGGELRYTDQRSTPELPLISTTLNLRTTAAYLMLDVPFDPTRGFSLTLEWGNGASAEPGDPLRRLLDDRHNWLEFQSTGFLPLGPRFVAAARFAAGRFFSEGGINSREFFLGGPRTIRAFEFRSIRPAPVDSGDLAPSYYLVTAELRSAVLDFPFVRRNLPLGSILSEIRLVPFVDYGRVWDSGKPSLPDDPGEAWAWGIGLRYRLLGIFHLRLDFAWGNTGSGRRDFRIVLDLAQAF